MTMVGNVKQDEAAVTLLLGVIIDRSPQRWLRCLPRVSVAPTGYRRGFD
jgi:hypothetical protein